MSRIIIAGTDEANLGAALAEFEVDLQRVDVANRPALEEAGIHEADLFVLTEAAQATAIPIARDLTDELRIVAYCHESLPEFVSGQEVISMDPDLLGPESLAEELIAD